MKLGKEDYLAATVIFVAFLLGCAFVYLVLHAHGPIWTGT